MATQLFNNCGSILFSTLDIYWLKMIQFFKLRDLILYQGFMQRGEVHWDLQPHAPNNYFMYIVAE